ncbi:MAG TPA: YCF48-related protein [Vicinamibacterales bacterium]|nr:YCF48-related protein [Vicinamibacterales bacterium]
MDRDRSMDALLRDTLGRQSPEGPCLDAETAAAWADGALTDADRRRVEGHAASCARCQALVAAIVRTSPPPIRSASFFRGFRLPGAAWLAPLGTLAAAAAALVIWTVVPSQQKPAPAPSSAATAAKTFVPPGPPPAAPTEELRSADARQNPVQAQSGSRLDAIGGAPTKKEEAFDRLQVAADKVAPAKQKEQEQAKLKDENVPGAAPVSAEQALAERKRDAAAGAAAGTVAGSVAESVTVTTVAPQAAQNSVASAPARRADSGLSTIVTSPDRAVQWRIANNNPVAGLLRTRTTVEHSTDGGLTWHEQPVEEGTAVTAGSAPSPNVCWLVGRRGTVMRTIDGTTWTRVAFPETVDLVAVRAADDKNATVTTADGRTFATADGGSTWKP